MPVKNPGHRERVAGKVTKMLDTTPTVRPPQAATDRSHLFLVRLWPDGADSAGHEWSGRVQHVVSGEAHTFEDWATLIEWLRGMLAAGSVTQLTDTARAAGSGDALW
jgi:hypothetical protein